MQKMLAAMLAAAVCAMFSACSVIGILGQGGRSPESSEANGLRINESGQFGNYGEDGEEPERAPATFDWEGIYNSVSTDGEYDLKIPGQSVVAEGVPGAPFSFYFPNSDTGGYYNSFIGAAALPVDEEIASLAAKMPGMGEEFGAYAEQLFGDNLREFSYGTVPYGESDIYKIWLLLEDHKNNLEVTACYRFEQSYYEFVFGINYGDLPDVHEMTVDAAKNFVDYTIQPMSAMPQLFFSMEYTVDRPDWEYPIANGLASIKEHMVRVFRDEVSAERRDGDYEIVWKTDYMEEFARAITGVENGPIMSSDLDPITELRLKGGDAGRSVYDLSDDYFSVRIETDSPITNLDDFEHFSKVDLLDIDVSTITDISALKDMPQMTEMYVFFNEDITDLSPIGYLTELRTLMLWGREYPLVEDASYVANLKKVERIFFSATGVKDIEPFLSLPNLTTLGLFVHKDVDPSLYVEYANQFEDFYINGEDIGGLT